jgi:hypothetical protein
MPWARNDQGDGSVLIKPVLNTIGKVPKETAARSARRSSDLRQKRKAATNQYPRERILSRTIG